MISIINLKLLMAVSMYFGIFGSYCLPSFLLKKKYFKINLDLISNNEFNLEREEQQKNIYSCCNCLAIGIFMAMCFVSMVPMVNEEFDSFLRQSNLEYINYPFGALTILLGFFLVLFFEQVLVHCREQKSPCLVLDEEIIEEQTSKLLGDDLLIKKNNCLKEAKLGIEEENDSNFLFSKNHPQSQPHSNSQNHSHHHHFGFSENDKKISLNFFLLIFASSVHSIFEGLALGLIKQNFKAVHLFIGIFLHECIVAVALGINASKISQNILFGLIFSFTIPFGIFLGILIGYTPGLIGKLISAVFQGLATGTFVHVAFYELLFTELNQNQEAKKNLKKIFLMFIGCVLMALLSIVSD